MSDAVVQETGQASKAKVFLSYSRKDIAFVDQLDTALRGRGFEALIDRSDIYAFEEWWQRIEALIARADTVVFVLSPNAVTSDVALKEVAFAASLNKRFAPIVYRCVDNKQVPEALAKLNFIFFDDPTQFERSADQLAEALKTDIGWIRQHTEFGEQARRWAAASESKGLLLRSPMLEQAERWIASRPSDAPTPTEETQAFVRLSRQAATWRRNVLTGSLAAGLMLALALAGAAYWQRGVAVQQTRIAEQQQVLAQEQKEIAKQNEAQAKEERDRATTNFRLAQKTADNLVIDIAQGLRNVQGMSTATVRKILETAKATFEQLGNSAPADLTLQRSRVAMLNEFGYTYRTLGDLDTALASYRESLSISEQLADAYPQDATTQYNLTVPLVGMGSVLFLQRKLEDALIPFKRSVEIMERVAASEPNNLKLQRSLASAYDYLSNVLLELRQLEETLRINQAAFKVFQHLAEAKPENTEWQRDWAVSYFKIGKVLQEQNKTDEAIGNYRNALAIFSRLASTDNTNVQWQRDIASCHGRVSDLLLLQNKIDDALVPVVESARIFKQLATLDPSNAQWQRDLAISQLKLASVYERQGRIADALQELAKGRDVMAALVAIAPGNAQWKSVFTLFERQIARLQGQRAR